MNTHKSSTQDWQTSSHGSIPAKSRIPRDWGKLWRCGVFPFLRFFVSLSIWKGKKKWSRNSKAPVATTESKYYIPVWISKLQNLHKQHINVLIIIMEPNVSPLTLFCKLQLSITVWLSFPSEAVTKNFSFTYTQMYIHIYEECRNLAFKV